MTHQIFTISSGLQTDPKPQRFAKKVARQFGEQIRYINLDDKSRYGFGVAAFLPTTDGQGLLNRTKTLVGLKEHVERMEKSLLRLRQTLQDIILNEQINSEDIKVVVNSDYYVSNAFADFLENNPLVTYDERIIPKTSTFRISDEEG